MKFGLFFNPVIPKQIGSDDWEPDQERTAFLNMIEEIRYADSLGLDYVFLGEHHYMPEYAHNSAPEVLLGAMSATTNRIRIGTGIVHASHNDPVRTAERIATLDQLTGGRVEYGYGGGTDAEIKPFVGADGVARKGAVANAAARVTADILATRGQWGGVSNEFFDFPSVNVVPKSYQSPHPPLWTSQTRAGQIGDIAERGLGVLMLSALGADAVAKDVETYWETLRSDRVQPIGRGVNPAIFVFVNGLLAETDELAEERVRYGLEYFGFGLTGGATAGVGNPDFHLTQAFEDFKAGRGDIRQGTGAPPMMLEMGGRFADLPLACFGTADRFRTYIRAQEAAHADAVLLRYDFPGVTHEWAMESLEILAKEVMPEFAEREAEHQEWRAKQLAGVPYPIVCSL